MAGSPIKDGKINSVILSLTSRSNYEVQILEGGNLNTIEDVLEEVIGLITQNEHTQNQSQTPKGQRNNEDNYSLEDLNLEQITTSTRCNYPHCQ